MKDNRVISKQGKDIQSSFTVQCNFQGITKLSHLLDQNAYPNFLSHAELKIQFNLQIPYLTYAGQKACIKKLEVIQNVFAGHLFTKTFYKAFKKQMETQDKWVKDCDIHNWAIVYTKYFLLYESSLLENSRFLKS